MNNIKDVIIIATIKSYNIRNAEQFKNQYSHYNTIIITRKEDLTFENINAVKPKYIFFPHWSWIIDEKIYTNYNCVVFHCTDLPFGRGGSPLQNLIIRKIYHTKISALKVSQGIDAGDIYLKKDFDISVGSAQEIFEKMSHIIFKELIPQILNNNIVPRPQTGETVTFKRRTPKDSLINMQSDINSIYDKIRMLDGEGYPKAFINIDNYKILFSDCTLKDGKLFMKAVMEEINE